MLIEIIKGLSVPFIGTTLGAFCVFFLKNELGKGMQKALTGFAAGVMIAHQYGVCCFRQLNRGLHLECGVLFRQQLDFGLEFYF